MPCINISRLLSGISLTEERRLPVVLWDVFKCFVFLLGRIDWIFVEACAGGIGERPFFNKVLHLSDKTYIVFLNL